MKSLLETLARELVDEPDQVSVTQWDEGDGLFLELSVAPEDRGFVIGKRGRTADALRTVLDAVARRRATNCDMEIVD
ncbi:MAG: KH domain-containing protein [Vicinamibacteria bacterium]